MDDIRTGGPAVPDKPTRPWKTHQAARWSGMSERQLLQLARDGVIPGRKIGGVWYFSPRRLAEIFDVEI